MSVFDATTRVRRAAPDRGADKRMPASGALSWGAVTSPAGLAGTNGADAKLVHGDRWDEVQGNRTVNILQNHTITVTQNETHTVIGDRRTVIVNNYHKTIVGIYNQTIIGIHNQVNISNRNNTFISTKVEIHTAPKQSQEPTGWFQYIRDNTVGYMYKSDWVSILNGLFCTADVKIALASGEAVAAKGTAVLFQWELLCFSIDAKLSDNRILAIAMKVDALNGHLGPLDMQAIGLKLMGLAFGANQYI